MDGLLTVGKRRLVRLHKSRKNATSTKKTGQRDGPVLKCGKFLIVSSFCEFSSYLLFSKPSSLIS